MRFRRLKRPILQSGEDETLEAQYQKVSHVREILSDCSAVHEMTAGQSGCAGDFDWFSSTKVIYGRKHRCRSEGT